MKIRSSKSIDTCFGVFTTTYASLDGADCLLFQNQYLGGITLYLDTNYGDTALRTTPTPRHPGYGNNDEYEAYLKLCDNHRVIIVETTTSYDCCAFNRTKIGFENGASTLRQEHKILVAMGSICLSAGAHKNASGSDSWIFVQHDELCMGALNTGLLALGYQLRQVVGSRMVDWLGSPVYRWVKPAPEPRRLSKSAWTVEDGKQQIQKILGCANAVGDGLNGAGDNNPGERTSCAVSPETTTTDASKTSWQLGGNLSLS